MSEEIDFPSIPALLLSKKNNLICFPTSSTGFVHRMRIPTTDQSIQINETFRYAPGSTLFLDLLMPRDYRKQSEGCYSIVVAGKGTAERVSLAKPKSGIPL